LVSIGLDRGKDAPIGEKVQAGEWVCRYVAVNWYRAGWSVAEENFPNSPKIMNKRMQSGRGWESAASRKTFPQRRKKPGEVGLANEVRPGLGTRAKASRAKETKAGSKAKPAKTVRYDKEPLGRVAPLPPAKPRRAPREQAPDSFAHELEHDTGVSGHASGD
jgi:hypothetical protein